MQQAIKTAQIVRFPVEKSRFGPDSGPDPVPEIRRSERLTKCPRRRPRTQVGHFQIGTLFILESGRWAAWVRDIRFGRRFKKSSKSKNKRDALGALKVIRVDGTRMKTGRSIEVPVRDDLLALLLHGLSSNGDARLFGQRVNDIINRSFTARKKVGREWMMFHSTRRWFDGSPVSWPRPDVPTPC